MTRVLRHDRLWPCHAWHMGNDNEQTQAEQRDVPGGEEAQRSWVEVAEAAVIGALATDVYNDVKIAGKVVLDKIRNDPPDPPPSGDGDGPA
jgi:hypothetical protein